METRNNLLAEFNARLAGFDPSWIEPLYTPLRLLIDASTDTTKLDRERQIIADLLRQNLREALENHGHHAAFHDLIFELQLCLARYWPTNKNDDGDIVALISQVPIEVDLDSDDVIPLSDGQLLLRSELVELYANEYYYRHRNPDGGFILKVPINPYNNAPLPERDQRHLLSKNIALLHHVDNNALGLVAAMFRAAASRRRGNPAGHHREDIRNRAPVWSAGPFENAGVRVGLIVGIVAHIALLCLVTVPIPWWILAPVSISAATVYTVRHRHDESDMPGIMRFFYGYLMANSGSAMGTTLISLIATGLISVLTIGAGAAAVSGIAAILTAAVPFAPLAFFVILSAAEYFRKDAMVNSFQAILLTPITIVALIGWQIGKGIDSLATCYSAFQQRRQRAAAERELVVPEIVVHHAQIQQGLGIAQAVNHHPDAVVLPEMPNADNDILMPWGRARGSYHVPVPVAAPRAGPGF